MLRRIRTCRTFPTSHKGLGAWNVLRRLWQIVPMGRHSIPPAFAFSVRTINTDIDVFTHNGYGRLKYEIFTRFWRFDLWVLIPPCICNILNVLNHGYGGCYMVIISIGYTIFQFGFNYGHIYSCQLLQPGNALHKIAVFAM